MIRISNISLPIDGDLEQLRKIASAMQKASLCGLGQTAPNPVLSTLKFYEKEYLDKLVDAEEK